MTLLVGGSRYTPLFFSPSPPALSSPRHPLRGGAQRERERGGRRALKILQQIMQRRDRPGDWARARARTTKKLNDTRPCFAPRRLCKGTDLRARARTEMPPAKVRSTYGFWRMAANASAREMAAPGRAKAVARRRAVFLGLRARGGSRPPGRGQRARRGTSKTSKDALLFLHTVGAREPIAA